MSDDFENPYRKLAEEADTPDVTWHDKEEEKKTEPKDDGYSPDSPVNHALDSIHHPPQTRMHRAGMFGEYDSDEDEEPASLWLVTFTDAMALMLTFFVLLYAMSTPIKEDWEDIQNGINRYYGKHESPAWYKGEQDVIDIDKLDFSRALDLTYLKSLIMDVRRKNEALHNIVLFPQKEYLAVSLPEDLLFEAGKAEVSEKGRQALFIIGGSLSNIRNRIEVIGHADPNPIPVSASGSGAIETNWELSLRRAMAVSQVLENVGYERSITVKGLSSGRYDELPQGWAASKKDSVSRRVDILIMRDSGAIRQRLSFDNAE
ncbi:MAG: hypothetical protein CMH26_03680 [Micavibrio sp.]|nr:hypothetical protein [Micavibrio sp.]|tara:strand:+ start:381 stop:1331 length:951 start_codon:yes stop_codon:yes gene_type:complete